MLNDQHEIIDFESHIPLKVFIHKLGTVPKHWHTSVELLMVLEGSIEITINGMPYNLEEEDIILINSNTIHEIHSSNAVLIALQIKLSKFRQFQTDLSSLVFDCNSSLDSDYDRYNNLRFTIASLIQSNAYHSDGTDYQNYSLSYYLIAQLLDNFKADTSDTLITQQKHMERLTHIITYINDHYHENLTLNDLAAIEGLSVPYLSQFFNKHMGVKFTQYYTGVKLEHALSDLITTNDSIETIAVNNGFTESHSFVRAFKNQYNMLPSAYRKHHKENSSAASPDNHFNYLLIEPSNYLKSLTKYLNNTRVNVVQRPSTEKKLLNVKDISCVNSITPLKHTFKTFLGVGRAKELLNYEIQEMLRDIQKNIGYKYIKFHGILSDDMMVVNRANGELKFHYTLVDMVLDFLLSIGIMPMIQLSFMPRELAKNPKQTVCYSPFITSPPAKMEEWNLLIEDFTKHLITRYGKDTVTDWLFTVWNEPATSQKMFGFGDDALFFKFYKNTYDTVKKVCSDIRFGTPSLLYIDNLGNDDWIRRFLNYTSSNYCRPDFLNIHYYSDIVPPTADDFFLAHAASSSFPKKEDDFSFFIGSIKKIFRSLQMGDLPIYMTEWNFTLSHRNLINDTSFKTCYIMKNLLKNYDRLDSFGYWSLTDLIEENALPDTLFHGGLGIYTLNGLRKGLFYTFYFANMLGNELITSGDGYFITKRDNRYQIITYYYIHYGDLFASGELFDMTETNRYSAFDTTKNLAVSLQLTDIENGNYIIKEYYVNRHHGNAFDLWLEMGAMPHDPQDTDLLRGLCVPAFHQEYLQSDSHTLTYTAELEPFEIRFAELRPVDR